MFETLYVRKAESAAFKNFCAFIVISVLVYVFSSTYNLHAVIIREVKIEVEINKRKNKLNLNIFKHKTKLKEEEKTHSVNELKLN